MRRILFKFQTLSVGERNLLWSHLIVALFGFAFGMVIVMRLDPAAFFTRGVTLYEAWMLLSGLLGGTLALRIFRSRIGTQNIGDAILAGVMMTMVAPIIAGTLALPIYGTMFGPFTLFLVFWVAPMTFVMWCVSLVAIHFLLGVWHRERNSIFGPADYRPLGFFQDLIRDLKIR